MIREIQSPLGDGNSVFHGICQDMFIREIQSPLGDGNYSLFKTLKYTHKTIREIHSPLGDGNHLLRNECIASRVLEKYSPR